MPRSVVWLLLGLTSLVLAGCAGGLKWGGERPAVGQKPAAVPTQSSVPAPPRKLGPDEYRVVLGDTLYSIAFRNNLDYRDVARWNGVGSDYRIEVGQVLQLKAPSSASGDRSVTVVSKPVVEAVSVTATVPAVSPPISSQSTAPITSKPAPVSERPMADIPSGYQWEWPTLGSLLKAYAPAQGSKGIDIGGNLGQPVFAAAPGRVVYSGNALKGYGELIIIKHDDTFLSAYGYNRKRYVTEGDIVTVGQPIGELGIGPESKPLLHFEVRKNGKPVNPLQYLPKRR